MKSLTIKLLLVFFAAISSSYVQDWDKVYDEYEVIRIVKKDGKYGAFDSDSKVVVAATYQRIFNFKPNGLAIAKKGWQIWFC